MVTMLLLIKKLSYSNKVDTKSVADGDTVTVYVSSKDPLVSSSLPKEVSLAAVKRAKAREKKNYTEADALHKTIIASGYRFVFFDILTNTRRS